MKKLASVWGLYGISYLDFQVDLCTNQHDVHLPKNQNLKNQNPFSSLYSADDQSMNQSNSLGCNMFCSSCLSKMGVEKQQLNKL